MGVGQSAFVRFRGFRPEFARTWMLEHEESDPFTAEQEGIERCLEDAEGQPGEGEITILTDSLSNISSLASAGPRDRRENRISGTLCRLAQRRKVVIRFTRAHTGTYGNELADALVTAGRSHWPRDARWRGGRRIAQNLCRSRLRETAWAGQRSKLRQASTRSVTIRHLLKCDKELKGNPLLLKKVRRGAATRRDEVIYNQMRLGSNVYPAGFRDQTGKAPPCPKCGEATSQKHTLLDCPDPIVADAREKLREELHTARRNAWEEAAEAALWRGKKPPSKAWINDRITEQDLTAHPAEILRFIQRGNYWLDMHARRQPARKKQTAHGRAK